MHGKTLFFGPSRAAAELIDRFGPLPEEVENLLQVIAIKRLCRAAGVEKVDAGPKGAVVAFHKNEFAKPAELIAFIASRAPVHIGACWWNCHRNGEFTGLSRYCWNPPDQFEWFPRIHCSSPVLRENLNTAS